MSSCGGGADAAAGNQLGGGVTNPGLNCEDVMESGVPPTRPCGYLRAYHTPTPLQAGRRPRQGRPHDGPLYSVAGASRLRRL